MDSSSSNNLKYHRKITRKQNRCKNILKKHEGLQTVDSPTNCLFVGNGGLICGIDREVLMDVFTPYGSVKDIKMVPSKSYSFVVYDGVDSARNAMSCVNGQKLKPESDFSLYLCYVKDVPHTMQSDNKLPLGLILIEDFITEEDELKLLGCINFDNEEDGSLKHRKVKHFGFEFNYANNNVDKDKPLEEKIPNICLDHLHKLMALGHISTIPNQLTVNHYLPGQGIPPHVDTHSAFKDGIISFSLGSQVIMDFYHPDKTHIPVLLERRSAIIMTGESRYMWKHGITPRKTDVVSIRENVSRYLTLKHRSTRTSFTFRLVRREPCVCDYPLQCDSQMFTGSQCKDTSRELLAKDVEKLYVTEVYENIADHFSETRFKPWPLVAKFMDSIPTGSIVVDAGCGNGKNMKNGIFFQIGCDVSLNLVSLCAEKKLNVVVANVLNLPFRSDSVDVCICIAVIHHMASKSRRLQAVQEIIRILRCGGKSLIYVWALEQETSNGPSNYLNLKKSAENYETEHSTASEVKILEDGIEQLLPIHQNRTKFKQQDVLVPWHKKTETIKDDSQVYHRFYHVFRKGELEELILENTATILDSYYDKGNWCVVFEKSTS